MEIVTRFLASQPRLELLTPMDATIVFPRMKDTANTDAFCDRAASQFGVTVVPGRFFDAPAHVRISVAGPTEQLTRGLERLGAALSAG
jgi:aspartate/methionine/tyrosine aminotransferase